MTVFSYTPLTITAVCAGGGIGVLTRYLCTLATQAVGIHVAWATFGVNIIGSLCVGICAAWLTVRGDDSVVRSFLLVGFFGGLTTFSGFALDAIRMLQRGAYVEVVFYTIASTVVAIVVCAAAFRYAIRIVSPA